jgi:hypothetical protein
VQDVMLAEEHVHGLHPFGKRDLSAELEVIHARVDGIKGGCTAKAGQLS